MIKLNIKLKLFVLPFILLVSGCAAPFKMMPEYYELHDRIQTIALYPLHYGEDGKEERLFGVIFCDNFFKSVEAMPMIRPLKFIGPDATISLLEEKGITITGHRGDIVKGATFPIYKQLTPGDLQAISKEVDGLIFCELVSYNEVSAGGQMGQAVATACLTGGLVAVSEKNLVKMNVIFFETTTGTTIWEYTPRFQGGLGEQRMKFTDKIIQGFRKYFPLSKEFQGT